MERKEKVRELDTSREHTPTETWLWRCCGVCSIELGAPRKYSVGSFQVPAWASVHGTGAEQSSLGVPEEELYTFLGEA